MLKHAPVLNCKEKYFYIKKFYEIEENLMYLADPRDEIKKVIKLLENELLGLQDKCQMVHNLKIQVSRLSQHRGLFEKGEMSIDNFLTYNNQVMDSVFSYIRDIREKISSS